MGGFLLPITFGAILDWIGFGSSCFMLLYGIIWVSLMLNYLTESGKRRPWEKARSPARDFSR